MKKCPEPQIRASVEEANTRRARRSKVPARKPQIRASVEEANTGASSRRSPTRSRCRKYAPPSRRRTPSRCEMSDVGSGTPQIRASVEEANTRRGASGPRRRTSSRKYAPPSRRRTQPEQVAPIPLRRLGRKYAPPSRRRTPTAPCHRHQLGCRRKYAPPSRRRTPEVVDDRRGAGRVAANTRLRRGGEHSTSNAPRGATWAPQIRASVEEANTTHRSRPVPSGRHAANTRLRRGGEHRNQRNVGVPGPHAANTRLRRGGEHATRPARSSVWLNGRNYAPPSRRRTRGERDAR